MAQISFTTKKESKQKQEDEFMKLTPAQRFSVFLKMCDEYAKFSTKPYDHGNNLVLERKKNKNEG